MTLFHLLPIFKIGTDLALQEPTFYSLCCSSCCLAAPSQCQIALNMDGAVDTLITPTSYTIYSYHKCTRQEVRSALYNYSSLAYRTLLIPLYTYTHHYARSRVLSLSCGDKRRYVRNKKVTFADAAKRSPYIYYSLPASYCSRLLYFISEACQYH